MGDLTADLIATSFNHMSSWSAVESHSLSERLNKSGRVNFFALSTHASSNDL